ncbi:F-box/FBD/LRR-repeat protein At1g13570-like isoform X2 [Olea europaea var. sylvestris]|nr:F-box/FBD/LRR-repeat protein At1g13570-like isoform X2 [Olea europaea var. sylvestris]
MMASEGLEDRISNLPSGIIDRILEYMSVRDAARTSILSRKWRDFWPMHSKLIFDEHTFRVIRHGVLLKPDNQIDKIINKILLQHMGPIVKFLLDLSYINSARYSDVDQWMFFLSRNGVQELSLLYSKLTGKYYRLPSYVFSSSSLEHLALHKVIIKPLACIFMGNLTSLSFKNVKFESSSSEGYSSCLRTPQLKRLSIEICNGIHHLEIVARSLEVLTIYSSAARCIGFLNPNIKEFNFAWRREVPTKHGFHLLSRLLAKLPKIQILHFDGFFLKYLAGGHTPSELPRTAEGLEYLKLDDLNFKDLDQIATVISLLQSCPNLCILDLKVSSRIITYGDAVLNYLNTPNCMKHNLIKRKTLRLYLYQNPVEELILLKLLLARSPSLVKIIIEETRHMDSVEGFRIARELLGFSRASPNANIIWNRCKTS